MKTSLLFLLFLSLNSAYSFDLIRCQVTVGQNGDIFKEFHDGIFSINLDNGNSSVEAPSGSSSPTKVLVQDHFVSSLMAARKSCTQSQEVNQYSFKILFENCVLKNSILHTTISYNAVTNRGVYQEYISRDSETAVRFFFINNCR